MAAFCAIDGYKVVAVNCPALHYLYLRAHDSKEGDAELPAGRTLFVANVPPEFTEATFKQLLKPICKVERVKISTRAQQRHQATRVRQMYGLPALPDSRIFFAHIVLKDGDALQRVLKVDTDAKTLRAEFLAKRGIDKWLSEHQAQFESPAHLQEEVDKAIEAYEAAEEKRRKQREAARNTVDEEGWTTVSYGRRRGEIEEVTDETKKKKKKQELLNFYRWQQREQRRDQIAELRRKFEEDKQKVALMRMSRKFKPY